MLVDSVGARVTTKKHISLPAAVKKIFVAINIK